MVIIVPEHIKKKLHLRTPNLNRPGNPLQCHKCLYLWNYNSDLTITTCPNCGHKVITKECKVTEEKT